jgi:penicillin amidase
MSPSRDATRNSPPDAIRAPDSAALRRALPDVTSDMAVPGLRETVEICRDAWGIPHVRARHVDDAFFGQGWVAAQDRLWQMDYDRLRARGRLCELVGAAALPADRQLLRFQLDVGLADDWARCTPETQAMLTAYAAGVNAFLATTTVLPIEHTLTGHTPAPWQPQDCLLVFKVRHVLMGVWDAKLWRARLLAHLGPETTALLLPEHPAGTAVSVPPDGHFSGPLAEVLAALSRGLSALTFLREEVDQGSNNWVLGPGLTASGAPIVAGDPHRAPDLPNVYYQNHVACPDWDVIGFSFPGVPGFPHFAHNGKVAWSITHGMADTQDLFVERFQPGPPLRVRRGEDWVPVETRSETRHVRGADPETIALYHTPHGPVIAGDPQRGTAIAFRFTATAAPNGTMNSIREMLDAADADALEAAQRHWVDPVNNLVYADTQGNFGYRARGVLPRRHRDNGWIPVPGWEAAHDWQGLVPFAEMPAVRNPAAGFAFSANHRITDGEAPYVGWDVVPPFRADRLQALLPARRDWDSAAMATLHGDLHAAPALAFAALWPRIDAAGDDAGGDPGLADALARLAAWDGRSTRDSTAATIYHAFRFALLRRIATPLLGPLAGEAFGGLNRGANLMLSRMQSALHRHIAADDARWLPAGTAWPGIMRDALGQALAELTQALGPVRETWQWERRHAIRAVHPLVPFLPQLGNALNPPPVPMAGDGDTVQAAGFTPAVGYHAQLVSVARYTFDVGDWERSGWIVPFGVPGHPGSPHYSDQSAAYERLETVPMSRDWARLTAGAGARQMLVPASD